MKRYIEISDRLFSAAKIAGVANGYSVSEQVQYWAQAGKACIDNPDLPVNFIVDAFESLKTKEDETKLFIRV